MTASNEIARQRVHVALAQLRAASAAVDAARQQLASLVGTGDAGELVGWSYVHTGTLADDVDEVIRALQPLRHSSAVDLDSAAKARLANGGSP